MLNKNHCHCHCQKFFVSAGPWRAL